MGKMGNGYGSEFHLLRYLGYHRHDLNREVEKTTGGRVTTWRVCPCTRMSSDSSSAH